MARTRNRRAARPHLDCLESRALLAGTAVTLGPANSLIAHFVGGRPTAGEAATLAALGAGVASTFEDGASLVAVQAPANLGRVLGVLRADPGVLYAVPNKAIQAAQVPNDPYFNQQWALSNPSGPDIEAARAWNITVGSPSVIVAVLDTGINYAHPDLYANVAINQGEIPPAIRSHLVDTAGDGLITIRDLNSLNAQGQVVPGADGRPINSAYVTDLNGNGYIDAGDLLADPRWMNGLDNDGNGLVNDLVGWNYHDATNRPLDDYGHGTMVAGIIGAAGNNGAGVAGIDWNARIMPLKFLGADGSGSDSDAILAIEYAADHGARVINASWGESQADPALGDAIAYAGARGTVFVAAAGNSHANNDASPFYPASDRLPNELSVAALDQSGNLASFSNYGPTTVDLAAPGANIETTSSGGGYTSGSGTSFAAPQVTGVVALLAGLHPEYTAAQLVQRITSTTRALPGLAGKVITGGMLDAYNAVNFPTPSPTLDYSAGFAGATGLGLTNRAAVVGDRACG